MVVTFSSPEIFEIYSYRCYICVQTFKASCSVCERKTKKRKRSDKQQTTVKAEAALKTKTQTLKSEKQTFVYDTELKDSILNISALIKTEKTKVNSPWDTKNHAIFFNLLARKICVLCSSDKKKKKTGLKTRRPVRKHALQRRFVVKSFALGDIKSRGGPPSRKGRSAFSFRDRLMKTRNRQNKFNLRWERLSSGLECVVAELRSECVRDRP